MPKVRELIVQYRPHPARIDQDDRIITTPIAVGLLQKFLSTEPYELFVCLHLDVKHRLLAIQTVGRGDLSVTLVCVRAILAAAIGEKNSAALILAHNHPSGDPTPSPHDLDITHRIRSAAQLFGIEVLDHIIIGNERYCSFHEDGRMQYV